MTDPMLFSFGVGISFMFLAGTYVYLRERGAHSLAQGQLIPIRSRQHSQPPASQARRG